MNPHTDDTRWTRPRSGDGDDPPVTGVLTCGATQRVIRGRALALILWLADHQSRLNAVAWQSGQLWLTWKGDSPDAIRGEFTTKL